MNNLLCCMFAVALATSLAPVRAQDNVDVTSPRENQGFAQTVAELTLKMKGEWQITSAQLLGAALPLKPFDALTIDDHGFTLRVQERERRFRFQQFRIDTRIFLAECVTADYPKGLVCEIGMSDEVVKIRYCTDGAHIAPEHQTADNQLLVQTWARKSEK